MKPPSGAKNIPELRVTRKQVHEVKHGEMGWAVSYADLLMVLLSFFTLYFSFADSASDSRESAVARIAMSMRGEKAAPADATAVEKMKALATAFNIDGFKVIEARDHLVVDLEKSLFRSGDYRMQPSVKAQVDTVVEKLTPYANSISLTVIGHADSKALVHKREFLEDNFDLSSARALTVLKYMIAKGWAAHQGAARAASSYDRNTRSISIDIRPFTETTGGT